MEFSSVNTIWVLLGAALVFFMQAGFSMCEAGFTRAKNTGNILMKNLMDFCIGTPCFWLVGFGIMFGAGTGLFGWFDPMIMKDYSSILPSGVPLWAYAIFQTVFCATSATIVSGAMAERTKFSAYCIYSAAISLLIYPISGHWIWGGGWLSELGFHDFAGSTCVHMVGGVCALIGAKMLGPRIGKYGKDGKPRAILGHNLTFAALGVFILWFCWFGFNGASTVGMDTDELIVSAGLVFFNTNLCTAVACCTTLIFTWLRYGKPDVSMTYNAALAGLVGITAGCDAVSPLGAAVMGIVFGLVIVLAVEFFDKVAKIDDPVGAISVHGVCGALGTILTGLFATGVSTEKGGFYGGGFHFFGVQCLGVASVILYVAVVITIVFAILKHTIGLRVTPEEEITGLDVSEHGLLTAYASHGLFFFLDIYQLLQRHVNSCLRKQCRYRIICDTGLVCLYDDFACKSKCCKEDFAVLKDLTNLGILGYHINGCFLAVRYVHAGTNRTDTAYCFLDRLNRIFFCFKVPFFFVLRPGGNHNGFLIGQVAEDLLRDERHVRMQHLQCIDQYIFQGPQSSALCLILVIPQTRFYHLDVPVAELLPDKVINLLQADAQLKLIQILGDVFLG